ncbi:MAG: glycosyltransferase [Salinibacter sp.]
MPSSANRPARPVMHVLVLPSWYPTTEAPRTGIYFVEQIQCLQDAGLQMGVVYPEQQSLRRGSWAALRRKHWQTEWTTEHGIPTLRQYGWNVWWRFPPGQRVRVRRAVQLGRRYVKRHGRPDLLHAHSARWAGAAAARLGDELDVPYVLTEHFTGFQRQSIFPWRLPLIREGFRRASAITTVSTSLKQTLVDQGFISPSEVTILPNLAPTSFFTLPSTRRSPPPFEFITVAQLHRKKNISGLLYAFSEAFSGDETATLTIVGDGPERGALERQANRLGVRPQITFRGALDRPALRTALWDADAFVLPSHHETFGVVLIEAMATGLPVIATRCGGPEDIVTPTTGRLVPPDDPAALADALRTMHRTHGTYEADVVRASALDRYGPEPFVRRTRAFYQRTLSA